MPGYGSPSFGACELSGGTEQRPRLPRILLPLSGVGAGVPGGGLKSLPHRHCWGPGPLGHLGRRRVLRLGLGWAGWPLPVVLTAREGLPLSPSPGLAPQSTVPNNACFGQSHLCSVPWVPVTPWALCPTVGGEGAVQLVLGPLCCVAGFLVSRDSISCIRKCQVDVGGAGGAEAGGNACQGSTRTSSRLGVAVHTCDPSRPGGGTTSSRQLGQFKLRDPAPK